MDPVRSGGKMNKFDNVEEQRKWNDPAMWSDGGHEWSKDFGDTEQLWNRYLLPIMKNYRNKYILEIAPGFGRITQFLATLAYELWVIDLNRLCIQKTLEKIGPQHIKQALVNDGLHLTNVPSCYFECVFSFDSFVHMHKNVTQSYIEEIGRVLKPGGEAVIHHGNLSGGQELSFENIGGRANMWPDLFRQFVTDAGMIVIKQMPFNFKTVSDCITIFKKI